MAINFAEFGEFNCQCLRFGKIELFSKKLPNAVTRHVISIGTGIPIVIEVENQLFCLFSFLPVVAL